MLDMTTKAFAHALVSSADDGAEQVHADSVVVDEAPPEIICGDTLAAPLQQRRARHDLHGAHGSLAVDIRQHFAKK